MAIEGFGAILSTVYIAKRLHEMGMYGLAQSSFFDALGCEAYHENMHSLIENLFEHNYCFFSNRHNMEAHILSDTVLADFYILAGEYGRRNGVPGETNPYMLASEKEAQRLLNFSYCLDWSLVGHTKPQRKFHSRLRVFISHDDYVDIGVLAYRLVELYDWFCRRNVELNMLLYNCAGGEEDTAA